MTKQILAFLFCFKRELNLYPHLRARTQTFTPPLHPSLNPPIRPSLNPFLRPPTLEPFRLYKTFGFTLRPSLNPSIHPKARGFIKPLVLTLTPSKSLRQKHGAVCICARSSHPLIRSPSRRTRSSALPQRWFIYYSCINLSFYCFCS